MDLKNAERRLDRLEAAIRGHREAKASVPDCTCWVTHAQEQDAELYACLDDAGPGAGRNAGPDAGRDAGPDAGRDAGPDAERTKAAGAPVETAEARVRMLETAIRRNREGKRSVPDCPCWGNAPQIVDAELYQALEDVP